MFCVFVYMRGGPSLIGGISLLATEISPRISPIFHIHTLKRTDPPRRASKLEFRTHNQGCHDLHFVDNFSFHKSVCFCVGYKRKTCTQILDSGFRGKINVVSPCDSAKLASPGRRAAFSHVNRR